MKTLSCEEAQQAAWYSAALYRRTAAGWAFSGYTEPRWMTWLEFTMGAPRGVDVCSYAMRHTGETGTQWEKVRA